MLTSATPHRADPVRFQPLAGLRVIDLTSVVMGPLATQMLGDLGADIITIESLAGDANRHMGVGPHRDLSGVAMNLMRNKRSVVLDIRQPAGYAALQRLIATADAFVTNLRPGSRHRAHVTYEDVGRIRPDIVYCAAAGFPADSAKADDAAYDDIIQAATGMVDVTARAGLRPTLSATLIADKVCGMTIAHAVTAGLLERARTGRGVEIQLAMYDVMRAFLLVEHGAGAIPQPPTGPAGYARLLSEERRPLTTRDGLVAVLAYQRHHFEQLIMIGGRLELLADPRFESRIGRIDHIDELYREYQRIAGSMTTAEFLHRCQERGVPAHAVTDFDEVVADLPIAEHPRAGAYRLVPSLAPGVALDAEPRRPAPLIGEHGRDVLHDAGYSDDDVAALEASGVLGPSTSRPDGSTVACLKDRPERLAADTPSRQPPCRTHAPAE